MKKKKTTTIQDFEITYAELQQKETIRKVVKYAKKYALIILGVSFFLCLMWFVGTIGILLFNK